MAGGSNLDIPVSFSSLQSLFSQGQGQNAGQAYIATQVLSLSQGAWTSAVPGGSMLGLYGCQTQGINIGASLLLGWSGNLLDFTATLHKQLFTAYSGGVGAGIFGCKLCMPALVIVDGLLHPLPYPPHQTIGEYRVGFILDEDGDYCDTPDSAIGIGGYCWYGTDYYVSAGQMGVALVYTHVWIPGANPPPCCQPVSHSASLPSL